ncbi:hypothetical protein C6341_g14739 [Phytophthora cactorum]|nr:hypothetical protein C6341_g14739 [Phytophthora cactorum]
MDGDVRRSRGRRPVVVGVEEVVKRRWQEGKRQEVAETSEEAEAKRANHDFRNSPADSAVPTKDSPKTPLTNIVLPIEKEGVVAAVAEVIPRPSPFGR